MTQRFVKVNKDYREADLAGNVYRVTGETLTHFTIEDGWLAECYTIERSECELMENKNESNRNTK